MSDMLTTLAERSLRAAAGPMAAPLVHETTRSMKNIVSTIVGGLRSPEVKTARAYFETNAAGDVRLVGCTKPLNAHASALLSGFSAHLDDFDDTHQKSSVHASAASFSSAFAAAQLGGADGDRFFQAFACGCELQLRIAWAMMPWHYERGWHITATVGSLGAALAAGIVQKLNAPQLATALAFACSQSLGLREAFGTSGKPFHPGKAAANGLLATELARAGLHASLSALTGPRGFYAVLSDEIVAERLEAAFGDEWLLLENTYKPYPCGLVVHPLIDLGIDLKAQGVNAEEVESIEVRAHPIVRELCGNPEPRTPLEARFSGIHGLAMGLSFGQANNDDFDVRGLQSDLVAQLRRRTRLIDDESVGWTGCMGVVRLRNGELVTAMVATARGSVQRPLSEGAMREKFFSQVRPVLSERADDLWAALEAMAPNVGFQSVITNSYPERERGGDCT